ncbi:unnamed protein product [Thelazia callipaeda]|uniref:Innexin n=1 Tax=Thelazia callipaeda TaxID=103827 RepID=A0A0N5CXT0_THECL|nr:unnamed protein product [Thelazia callipaeda]
MWREVFFFALLILALYRIPALWLYLFGVQICCAHRFRFVLIKSITSIEGDAFERVLENYRLNACLDVIKYTDHLRVAFVEIGYSPIPSHYI